MSELNAKLVQAVDDLLEDIDALDATDENKPLYDLDEKLKIIAAATKLEALRLKQEDDGEGSAFRRPQSGEPSESAN